MTRGGQSHGCYRDDHGTCEYPSSCSCFCHRPRIAGQVSVVEDEDGTKLTYVGGHEIGDWLRDLGLEGKQVEIEVTIKPS
jgi:hypothetical protein